MSTSFNLMSDLDQESTIALRFWGGDKNGCTVRFAFPQSLLMHLKDVELVGDNGETITVGQLHDSVKSIDFLRDDNSPREHLALGTNGSREQARLAWENS